MKTFGLLLLLFLFGFMFQACNQDDNGPTVQPPSEGAIIDANVGGQTQPNIVFIDLSDERQDSLNRNTWDLAFFCGEGSFVSLNVATEMLAYKLDQTDITAVNAEDTAGLGGKLSLDAIFAAAIGSNLPDWLASATTWTDDPSGDLTKTAIKSVSETESENIVFIINRGKSPNGSPRGWKKVRILRHQTGYTVQHADIGSADFEEVTVPKDSKYNFAYLNFDDGILTAEPENSKWDIAFTTYTDLTNFGLPYNIPYFFKDYVIQNRSGVEVATVMKVSDLVMEYDSLKIADISGLTFSEKVNSIGASWRSIIPQVGSAAVKDDRFFVIKDGDGNYYKLLFTKMLSNTGERGYPQIQYALVK